MGFGIRFVTVVILQISCSVMAQIDEKRPLTPVQNTVHSRNLGYEGLKRIKDREYFYYIKLLSQPNTIIKKYNRREINYLADKMYLLPVTQTELRYNVETYHQITASTLPRTEQRDMKPSDLQR